MPELAAPRGLFATMRNLSRSSKFSTGPPCHTRNVLLVAGCAGVERPVIAPSWTDQNVGSPAQDERSAPLKRSTGAGAPAVADCADNREQARTSSSDRTFTIRTLPRTRDMRQSAPT